MSEENPGLFRELLGQNVTFLCCFLFVFYLSKYLDWTSHNESKMPLKHWHCLRLCQSSHHSRCSCCVGVRVCTGTNLSTRGISGIFTNTFLLPKAVSSTGYIIHLHPMIALYLLHVGNFDKDRKELYCVHGGHNGEHSGNKNSPERAKVTYQRLK